MAFLPIKDAPLKTSIVGDEKIPTGGYGDLTVTVQQIKDFTALAFSNVDNTSDANKPVSVATQAALDLKANVSDVNTSLALKSDKTYVDDQLALKASKIYVDTELQKTASKTYVDNQLATKASTTYVDSINAQKANVSYVDSELALKSDITYVDTALANKTHNSLVGRDVDNAHPATAIIDASGKHQQEINDFRLLTIEEFGGGVGIVNNSAAITAANSAKSVIYAKGTYKVSSNTTITHNMEIIDSKIQPATGVVITVDNKVIIDANCEWMDTSLGGTFDFIAGAFERRISKISTSPTSEYNINQGYPANQISNQAPGVFVNGGTRSFPHKIGANSGLSVIGGAYDNTIEANAIASTIAGGAHHIVKSGATHASVLGGSYHTTFGNYSTLGGGTQNKVGSNYSTVGGGQNNIAGDETLASLDDSRSAVVAGGASNTAKGKWSAICGGSTNTIPNTAESAAVLGGRNNSASGIQAAILGGYNNTASGQSSAIIGGQANTASTTTACAGGNASNATGISSFAYGDYCTASGLQSVATGARCNAYLAGMKAHGNGWFAVAGDAQISDLVARITTTDSVVKRLDLNGGAATPIALPNNKTWMFVITIVARNTAASEHAAYEIKGCIKRDTAANTTAFIGTPTVTVIAESVAGWDVAVNANTTTGALDINVTGEAAKTIRWVARIQLTEVGV